METPGLGSENRLNVVVTDNSQSGVTSGTTYSANESTVVVGTPDSYKPIDPKYLAAARTGAGDDIASFLAKPLCVASGLLSSTDIFTTPIYQVDIPHGLLGNTIWKNKLDGLAAFRGTLHISIQLNANRFQQGRYILAWVPTGGAKDGDLFARMHSATLCQMTQLPHVEIDLACDTEANLVIPYITVQSWAFLSYNNQPTLKSGSNGYLKLVPYSPLVSPSGTNFASFSIFAHWENVELALPMHPQSSARVKTKVRRRNVADKEQASQNMGPVQAGLTKVATVGKQLAAIPLLSSVAAPVAWAADAAARVASIFGWSRPHNSEHPMLMQSSFMYRFTNTDVADNSTKLAYTDRNELEDVPGFAGSDLDEMNLLYIATTSAWYKTCNWNTSSATGVRINQTAVSPRYFVTDSMQGTDRLYHPTPLAFVSSFFRLWRGSIKFKFKLVKTEFHSGRLVVSFLPYDEIMGSVNFPTLAETTYLHRMIIDVREGNEFTFVVPFATLSQYKAVSGSNAISGYLFVDVLNELTAPANVSSNVTILIEVSAAEDFEWAGPADLNCQVAAQYQPQSGRKNVCEIVSTDLGVTSTNVGTATSRACAGERILSFRSIIKRFVPYRKVAAFAPSATNRALWFLPWFVSVDTPGTGGARVKGDMSADLFSLITSCYAIARGSVRMKFIDTSSTPIQSCMVHLRGIGTGANTQSAMWWTDTVGFAASNPTMAFFKPVSAGGAEVDFPYFNKQFATAVADMMATGSTATAVAKYTDSSTAPVLAGVVEVFQTATQPYVLRAAGEDYSLGLFVSVPPLYDWDTSWQG